MTTGTRIPMYAPLPCSSSSSDSTSTQLRRIRAAAAALSAPRCLAFVSVAPHCRQHYHTCSNATSSLQFVNDVTEKEQRYGSKATGMAGTGDAPERYTDMAAIRATVQAADQNSVKGRTTDFAGGYGGANGDVAEQSTDAKGGTAATNTGALQTSSGGLSAAAQMELKSKAKQDDGGK